MVPVSIFNSFTEWLQLVFTHRNAAEINVSIMVCWALWKNRNDLVWNQKCLEVPKVLATAISVLNQWRFVQDKSFDSSLMSLTEWLQLVFTHRNAAAINVSVMVCWALWKNRNDLVWNQKCLEVPKVLATAISVLNQWRFVQDKSFDSSLGLMNQEDGREQWQAPMLNRVKINTDAAIFNDLNKFSHSIVVRGHNGNMIEAKSTCYQGTVSLDLAEAMEIREALS